MKFGVKLSIIAVLALSVGVAFASPLLYENLVVRPFPRILEGPKADFSVEVVYANFSVQEHASIQSFGVIPLSIVTYDVVLNVTNLSDLRAIVGRLDLTVAEEVNFVPSMVGGFSASSGSGRSGGGGNGFVEGVWLDNEWVNVTWLPDGEWPIFSPSRNTNFTTVIPNLPPNATQEGVWIEGVHVWQEYNLTKTSDDTIINMATYIFINGTWVDVTGRIRVDNEQPYVMATNTLVYEMRNFESEDYGSYRNVTEFEEAMAKQSASSLPNFGWTYMWAGEGGFNNYWEPHESRLIRLTGTREVGVNAGLESLAEGKIMLYAGVSNYLEERREINGIYLNTFSTATELKQVQVEKTADGYLYNTILGENQIFQPDQFGVEVFIKPRS
jgi:hypothetical protein